MRKDEVENQSKQLRQNEERLKLALSTVRAGIWEWDLHGNDCYWSDEIWDLFGLDREKDAASYDSWWRSILPDDLKTVENSVQSAAFSRKELKVEWRVNLPDDQERWLMAIGQPVDDDSDEGTDYRGVVIDITERKKVEQSFITREKYMRAVLHKTSQGFWVSDTSAKIIDANEAYCRMSGYTLEELQKLHVSDIDAVEKPAETVERIKRVIEKGEELFETRHRRKDGSVFDVEVSLTFLEDESDKLVLFCRDITDRKQAEARLNQSERLLTATQNISKVGGWEWDLLDRTMTWTNETYNIHEIDIAALEPDAQKRIDASLNCYDPEDRNKVIGAFNHCAEFGEPYDMKFPFTTFKGRRIWIRTTAKAIYSGNRIVRVLGSIMDITDQKKIEDSLRENTADVMALIDNPVDSVFLSDINGIILAANQTFAQRFGKNKDELIGKCVYDLIPPELAKTRRAKAEEIIHSGLPVRFQDQRAGIWLDQSVHPIFDAQGKVVRIAIIARDITEHKQIEAALRESEEIFSQFMEHSPIYVFFKDRDIRSLRLSRNYEEMLGVPLDSLLGKTMDELFPSELAKTMAADDKRVLNDRKVLTIEEELNGRFYETIKFPIVIEGEPRYLAGYTIDITEKKLAEKALRKSEEKYRELYENAPVGIFRTDYSGKPESINSALACMLGFSSSQEAIDHYSDLAVQLYVRPERRDEFLRLLLEKGSVSEFEYEARTFDGRHIWVSMSARIQEQKEDGRFMIEGFAVDITERKQAENASRIQYELSRALGATLDLKEGLKASLSAAIRLSEMDCGGVYLVDQESKGLRLACHEGLSEALVRNVAAFDADSPNVLFILKEQSIYTTCQDMTEIDQDLNEGLRGVGIIPIFHQGRVIACLSLASHTKDDVPVKCRELLESVADRIGSFISIALLYKELQESEQKHRMLLKGLPDVVMRFDREARPLSVSENIQNFLNIKSEQLIGRTPREMGFPEAQCRFSEETIQKVFVSGDSIETELSVQGKNGERILNVRLMPEFDSGGNVKSVLGIYRDITDHRKVEHDYQTLFREMLEGFALHEIICNSQGDPVNYRFLAVNPAFENMTGMRSSDIIGKTVLDAFPDIEQSWIETYGRVALTGQPITFENYSAELNKHFKVTAFRPVEGQFACIFSDITEQKKIEREKIKLESQFQQAQKMESIGRLAGGVAHDFNNMLSVIIGNTELAISAITPDQPMYEKLNEVRLAAKRSADLTRQLLAFARKQTITPKVINLNETIESMLKMLMRLIGEDIGLKWIPEDGLWLTKLDPSQIDQILANLCINARDAIKGNGTITVKTGNIFLDSTYCVKNPGSVPGEYVMLSIDDTGCGMGQDTLDKLFEPFFTTKEVGKGTGLGLATVYGIVKQNNGFIDVTSEPDRGTTFTIFIPRFKGKSEIEVKRKESALIEQGKETILLVEDDPNILDMTYKILRHFGYTVLAAARPGEAINLAERHQGDLHLVITDVVMPEMNGRDLVKNILMLYPKIKRLFMSGYTADVISYHGVIEEGVHFIQKPFSVNSLAEKVRETLDSK
jgi:two-component system, cell cycle sensor histidine kinase and response regulator CckA